MSVVVLIDGVINEDLLIKGGSCVNKDIIFETWRVRVVFVAGNKFSIMGL